MGAYTKLVKNLLDGVEVRLNIDYTSKAMPLLTTLTERLLELAV